jgi:hypothetical protein
MTFDWVQLVIAVVAAVVGFLARGRTPAPKPIPEPAPGPNGQFPLLELILKLLAERFRIPLPGEPFQEGAAPTAVHPEPPWAQKIIDEVRSLRKAA